MVGDKPPSWNDGSKMGSAGSKNMTISLYPRLFSPPPSAAPRTEGLLRIEGANKF